MRAYMVVLCLLFIALGHPSLAQKSSGAAAGEESVVRVALGAPLTVECPLRVEQRAEWRLEGAAPPPDLREAGEAPARGGARLAASLHAAAARAHHAGLYTCSRDPRAHRVRVLVLPAPHGEGTSAAVAGATTAAPVGAPVDAAADADADSDLIPYTFEVNRHFTLNCTPAADVDTSGAVFLWQKNGTEVEKVPELKDRYKLEERNMVFHLSARAHEDDFGNYTCLINNLEARAWRVRASPIARLPPNSNVVEGQKLKITCKLIGKPYPPVDWTYALDETTNLTVPAEEALGARLLLADSAAGVPRGELSLEAAQRGDAGVFTCVPRGAPPAAAARTVLRVKDMYAALWPFLGICAEVFVLCAIILVYEKRRTKPELDDSDTDNHDQ